MDQPAEPSSTSALVTVVISTYNRPDTLRQAIQSVMLQSESRWALLVVGDGCDERTAEVMGAWTQDPRVAYVNLPLRCGEQALPNSAALAVVKTPFVALLNHDDLWLPDHLQVALSRLESSGGALYLGRALTCSPGGNSSSGPHAMGVGVKAPPVARQLSDAFSLPFEWFEPASAWVMRAKDAQRVGPWRPSAQMFRVPLQEWLLRAWRADLTLAPAPDITCLKINDHGSVQRGSLRYGLPAALHQHLMSGIQAAVQQGSVRSGAVLRALGLSDQVSWRSQSKLIQRRGVLARWMGHALGWRCWLLLYRYFGWDAHALFSWTLGLRRGQWMAQQLASRTGERLASPHEVSVVIEHLERGLANQPRWRGHGATQA